MHLTTDPDSSGLTVTVDLAAASVVLRGELDRDAAHHLVDAAGAHLDHRAAHRHGPRGVPATPVTGPDPT